MKYGLPKSVEIQGTDYDIRSDYRDILTICAALSDVELNDQEKAYVVLAVFYPDFEEMPSQHWQEALEKCFAFVNCGQEETQISAQKLVDWEQDFQYIVAPINRVMGQEIRSVEYLHWWTFISAYYEIGDCLFSQIVRIRNLLAKGKTLDKADREWLRINRHLVDFKTKYTDVENEILKQFV